MPVGSIFFLQFLLVIVVGWGVRKNLLCCVWKVWVCEEGFAV